MIYDNHPFYFRKNLQGDVIAITDWAGLTVARYAYDAWGKCTIVDLARTHEIAEINPFRYRSYYYDSETALYYLQSRYYDPTLGRFVNADDVRFLGSTPVYANIFVYCANNLPNTVDSGGYSPLTLEDFRNDWAGREILKNYLFGGGKTRTYNSAKWANYVRNRKMCNYSCCSYNKFGNRTLRKYITDFAYNQRKDFNLKRIGQTRRLVYRINASIKNGEGIVGYNYLHGTDMKAGGLYLRIVARKLIRSVFVTVDCTWNDWINANFKYDSDKYKADLAKKIPFANPTDYIIRISWTEWFVIGGM